MVMKTSSLALREREVKDFENNVFRKVFGAKRGEIIGEWRKLHALCSLPNIIRNHKSKRLRWAGHISHMEESRNVYRV